MAEWGEVSVVIPHWNREDLLAQILKHLCRQQYPISEVIVVDNGSTDDSVAVARTAGATTIEMGHNAGFAPAVNRGLKSVTTPWVVILNNDVEFGPEWLSALVSSASRQDAGFAAGKLVRSSDPSVIDGGFDAVCRGGTAWRCGSGQPDGPLWNQTRTVQFVPFTAALFRRDVFDRIGLLDERFESYLEDVDFGLRCSAGGIRGVYAPEAVAAHLGSATLGAWHDATVRRIARNQMFIVAKHFEGAARWPIVVAHVLWCMLAFRHGGGWASLRGKWEGIRWFRQMRGNEGNWKALQAVVERSEREIQELQQQFGFESYWRWYFALTKGTL